MTPKELSDAIQKALSQASDSASFCTGEDQEPPSEIEMALIRSDPEYRARRVRPSPDLLTISQDIFQLKKMCLYLFQNLHIDVPKDLVI